MSLRKMNGFDDCIVGVVHRYGMEPVLCYDQEKVVEKLIANGMTMDEAVEFFYYNQIGAWVGNGTPCFLMTRDWEGFINDQEEETDQ